MDKTNRGLKFKVEMAQFSRVTDNTQQSSRKNRAVVFSLAVLSCGFMIASGHIASVRTGEATHFFGNLAPFCFLMAVGVFVFIKSWCDSFESKRNLSMRFQNLFAYFSKISFGVYLAHALFMIIVMDIFNITPLTVLTPAISIPIIATTIIVLSVALSALLNAIPKIKDWVV